jgi:hypothetical protein
MICIRVLAQIFHNLAADQKEAQLFNGIVKVNGVSIHGTPGYDDIKFLPE